MATARAKITVGLFVLTGMALAVAAIIWLGMTDFFDTGKRYVAYFDESVQGLERDSPVKYRGVTIGRVGGIAVAPDATLIEVTLTIETAEDMDPAKEMVAKVSSVGITGIKFIELDRTRPSDASGGAGAATPTGGNLSFEPPHPVVLTRPSDLKQLFASVDEVLNQINTLDIRRISEKLQQTIDNINQIFADADIKGISEDVRTFMSAVQKILDAEALGRIMTGLRQVADNLDAVTGNANETVVDVRAHLNALLSEARTMLTNLQKAASGVEGIISGNRREIDALVKSLSQSIKSVDRLMSQGADLVATSEVRLSAMERSLLETLRNLETTTDTLRGFAEAISNKPSRLIFGKPAPPRRIPPGD